MAHYKSIIFLLISESMNKPSFFNEVLTHTIPYFSTICGKKQPQFCFICLVWIFHYSSREVLSKYFSRRKKLHVSLTYSHYIFTTASSHSQFEMTTTFLSSTAFFFFLPSSFTFLTLNGVSFLLKMPHSIHLGDT